MREKAGWGVVELIVVCIMERFKKVLSREENHANAACGIS